AEEAGADSVGSEHVRRAKGSLLPTMSETQLESLSTHELGVLLALSRTLKRRGASVASQKLRSNHTALLEELGSAPMSRTTFWRTLMELERDGLVVLESGSTGESNSVSMDEVPASFLTTLLEERLGRRRARKD
ncbi:MAG: hypothetical protein ACHQ0I_03645, partial [Candidatus Lutacidiplasmatales archaeon]